MRLTKADEAALRRDVRVAKGVAEAGLNMTKAWVQDAANLQIKLNGVVLKLQEIQDILDEKARER